MFNVLMYLFETYIHTEAELRVNQTNLNESTDAGFQVQCPAMAGKTC